MKNLVAVKGQFLSGRNHSFAATVFFYQYKLRKYNYTSVLISIIILLHPLHK